MSVSLLPLKYLRVVMAAVSNMLKKETIVVITSFTLSMTMKISSCSEQHCFQQASESKLRWAKSGA